MQRRNVEMICNGRFAACGRACSHTSGVQGCRNRRGNFLNGRPRGKARFNVPDAIREGATIVRIGTAIYGERDYSKKV